MMLANAEHNKDIDVKGHDPKRIGELVGIRLDAAKFVNAVRPVMFPEDDDG